MAEQVPIGLPKIIASLRVRFWFLNPHYEAAWTDSWSHRRCLSAHSTLIDAAKCAMPHGAGWYVFAVENDSPRQLTDAEDKVANEFRFGEILRHSCAEGSALRGEDPGARNSPGHPALSTDSCDGILG
jgi:hypothetical protein